MRHGIACVSWASTSARNGSGWRSRTRRAGSPCRSATLERRNDRSALRQIAEIARQEGVERLVLGEPVELYGRRGAIAERVAPLRRAGWPR